MNSDVDDIAVVEAKEAVVVGMLVYGVLCPLLSTTLVVATLQVAAFSIGEENAILLLGGIILDADETFSVVCG